MFEIISRIFRHVQKIGKTNRTLFSQTQVVYWREGGKQETEKRLFEHLSAGGAFMSIWTIISRAGLFINSQNYWKTNNISVTVFTKKRPKICFRFFYLEKPTNLRQLQHIDIYLFTFEMCRILKLLTEMVRKLENHLGRSFRRHREFQEIVCVFPVRCTCRSPLHTTSWKHEKCWIHPILLKETNIVHPIFGKLKKHWNS